MTWILGTLTLPDPKGFARRHIEKETMHEAINGRSVRDISSRKEQFVLSYTRLSQGTISGILAQYNLAEALPFSVNETNLQIAETQVHVHISDRGYNTKGAEFREDVNIILTEVQ